MTALLRQYEQQDNDIDMYHDAFSEDYDIDAALDREGLDEYGIQKAMQFANNLVLILVKSATEFEATS